MKTSLTKIEPGKTYVYQYITDNNKFGRNRPNGRTITSVYGMRRVYKAESGTHLKSMDSSEIEINPAYNVSPMETLIEVGYDPEVVYATAPLGLMVTAPNSKQYMFLGAKELSPEQTAIHLMRLSDGKTIKHVIDSIEELFTDHGWVQQGIAKHPWNYLSPEAQNIVTEITDFRPPKQAIDSLQKLLDVRPNFRAWARFIKGKTVDGLVAPFNEIDETNWMIWREFSRWVELDWSVTETRQPITFLTHPSLGGPIAGHFPALAQKEGMVSFTKDLNDRTRDRRTTMKVGRYLRKFYSDLTDETIKQIVASQVGAHGFTIHIATATNDIVNAYLKGPDSCASYNPDDDKWYSHIPREADIHPTMVYGDNSDIILYYAMDVKGRIVARTLVNKVKEEYVRIYQCDSAEGAAADLRDYLEEKGIYQNDNALVDARLNKIELENGYIVCPFIDRGDGGTSKPVAVYDDYIMPMDHCRDERIHERLPADVEYWGRPKYSEGGFYTKRAPVTETCSCCGDRTTMEAGAQHDVDDNVVCVHCLDNYYTHAAVELNDENAFVHYGWVRSSDALYISPLSTTISAHLRDEVIERFDLVQVADTDQLIHKRNAARYNDQWHPKANLVAVGDQIFHVNELRTLQSDSRVLRISPITTEMDLARSA